MRSLNVILVVLSLQIFAQPYVNAGTFSVADSRAQALGGTSVALGNTEQGFYYNPALSAMHKGDEDDHQHGRYSFSLLVDGFSDGARTAADALTEDLEGQLSDAIAALNASTDVDNARRAISAVQELERSMRKLQEEDIYANLFTGFSISEPGHEEGGAFFIGSYLIGVGDSNIEESDLDLLDDYLEALVYIESFGSEGQEHPELRDAEGNFIDPSENILSSAEGAALVVTEAGLSAAKQVHIFGQDFSFGVAPKVVYLRSYNEQWGVNDGDFDNERENENLLYLNLDLGMLWQYKERWRVGLSVRDAIAKRWHTSLGRTFELKPRTRLGLAYWGDKIRIGFDADLAKRRHLHTEAAIQEVSLGTEWQISHRLAVRVGYRHDLEDTLGSSVAGGLAIGWGRFSTEFSLSSGDFDQGAALQLSFYH